METIIDTTVFFTIYFVLFPQMFTALQRYVVSTQLARALAQSVQLYGHFLTLSLFHSVPVSSSSTNHRFILHKGGRGAGRSLLSPPILL